jgi:hypothetical protein
MITTTLLDWYATLRSAWRALVYGLSAPARGPLLGPYPRPRSPPADDEATLEPALSE